jgi:hypothetical protein
MAWLAPKVLAADYPTIDVEATMVGWPSALDLLDSSGSLTPDGNFGYYIPAWERGQVLGDTTTAVPPAATAPPSPSANVSRTTPPAPSASGCPATPVCQTDYALKYPVSGCPYCEANQTPATQNQAATEYCPVLDALATKEQCDVAGQTKSNQPAVCPTRSINCPSWVPASGSACAWCNYTGQEPDDNQPKTNQTDSLVKPPASPAETGSAIDWSAISTEIGKIQTEATRMLKSKDVSYAVVSNVVKSSTSSMRAIKGAVTREDKAALADQYSGPASILDNLRALLDKEKARVAYSQESLKTAAEHDKTAKFLAGLKPLRYVNADVNGWKGSLEYQRKILQKAKELAAADDPAEARNTVRAAVSDNRLADIYCVAVAARDFDKNLALVKNEAMRTSLIDDLANPIFAAADTRVVCQFLSKGNTRSSVMTLINQARNLTKLNSALSKKLQNLQAKIVSFSEPADK